MNPITFESISILEWVLTYFAMFALIFGRYVFVSFMFYLGFHIIRKNDYQTRKVGKQLRQVNQSRKEIYRSFLSSAVFAFGGVLILMAWKMGYTQIYASWDEYGYWWLPVSLLLVMFIHETYYYWLHRWMHKPKIYRMIHQTHHDSIVTSPWTSFAFSPIESLLQMILIPLLLFIIPVQQFVVMALLIIMTISATINHLDIEIYPKNFNRHFIGKWIIGATHHSLHHSEFLTNYGLYFTFWDHMMNTESEQFDPTFDELTSSSHS